MTGTNTDFRHVLSQLATGRPLNQDAAMTAFDLMMEGHATPAQIGAFLMGLRVRGETVEELAAGALSLRQRMAVVETKHDAIDTCGTGGDAKGTHNISTAVALVAAGCGVPIAKHGNRGLSSKSGSADVLRALGVNLDAPLEHLPEILEEAGICFMMAPRHHGAMKHVAAPRVELGTRTIFNLLGPLANPARVTRQIVGVFAEEWVEPVAKVLGRLGSKRAWVVHSRDGLDELSTTGPTLVAEWTGGSVRSFEVTPEDAGLDRTSIQDLLGGDPEENAQAIRQVLTGKHGALRDIVLLGAAAVLVIADRAEDLREGAKQAAASIDGGHADRCLKTLVLASNRVPAS